MDKREKVKRKWRFSFKKLLVIYLLAIMIISAWYWKNYKLKMEKKHNAKAKQLFNHSTVTKKDLIKLKNLTHATKLYLWNVSNAKLAYLKYLTNLTQLSLTVISDAGLTEI